MKGNIEMPNLCLFCEKEVKKVKTRTLESLLIDLSQIEEVSYFVCINPDCEIVYFSNTSDRTFKKRDLKLSFGLKEQKSPRQLCYCFDHFYEEIEEEITKTGNSLVIPQIKDAMKSQGCSCESTNPMGACCMGEISKIVQVLKSKNPLVLGQDEAEEKVDDCCSAKTI